MHSHGHKSQKEHSRALAFIRGSCLAAILERLTAGEDIRVLDVRDLEEFEAAHIPGSSPFPLGLVRAHAKEVARDRRIVLVCRTGRRSAETLRFLREAGMSNVSHLEGGLEAWKRAKLPIDCSPDFSAWAAAS